MLNDYKPTHDPNIDTFKVQYLLGGSAVLAVLFPYRYEIAEVSGFLSRQGRPHSSRSTDSLGFFDMARVCCDSPTAFHAATNGRSGDDYNPLSFRIRTIQSTIHPQLALSIFCRRLCRPNTLDRGHGSDNPVFGFLLDILHKVGHPTYHSFSNPLMVFHTLNFLQSVTREKV